MKLAFSNLLAVVIVSMVLVIVESQQASAKMEGELYIKRGPGGGAGGRGRGGGTRGTGRATGITGASGDVGKTSGTGRGGGVSKGSKASNGGSARGVGAREGTIAGAGTGVGGGGRRTGGAGGGTSGTAGGRAGGGGGGGRRRMAKRQIEMKIDLDKRESNGKVVDDLTLEKRTVDEMQAEKRENGDSNEVLGAAMPAFVKRRIDQDPTEFQKRTARNPSGMHPVKRDVETGLEKRNGHTGHSGTTTGHIPAGGMMKRSPNLQNSQETLIKRSPSHFKNNKGGRSRGRGGMSGFRMGGMGMGMKKRSLGGKERLSLNGPLLN